MHRGSKFLRMGNPTACRSGVLRPNHRGVEYEPRAGKTEPRVPRPPTPERRVHTLGVEHPSMNRGNRDVRSTEVSQSAAYTCPTLSVFIKPPACARRCGSAATSAGPTRRKLRNGSRQASLTPWAVQPPLWMEAVGRRPRPGPYRVMSRNFTGKAPRSGRAVTADRATTRVPIERGGRSRARGTHAGPFARLHRRARRAGDALRVPRFCDRRQANAALDGRMPMTCTWVRWRGNRHGHRQGYDLRNGENLPLARDSSWRRRSGHPAGPNPERHRPRPNG
jgi:hypothetical protein